MMNRIFKWVIVASRLWVLTTVLCGANVLTSCTSYNDDNPTAMIQGGGWDPQVQTALNGLMANFGEGSYAVFDFDQTSIVRSYKILRKKVMIPVLIKSANIAPMMGTMRKGSYRCSLNHV